jgi:hypothetical protein
LKEIQEDDLDTIDYFNYLISFTDIMNEILKIIKPDQEISKAHFIKPELYGKFPSHVFNDDLNAVKCLRSILVHGVSDSKNHYLFKDIKAKEGKRIYMDVYFTYNDQIYKIFPSYNTTQRNSYGRFVFSISNLEANEDVEFRITLFLEEILQFMESIIKEYKSAINLNEYIKNTNDKDREVIQKIRNAKATYRLKSKNYTGLDGI